MWLETAGQHRPGLGDPESVIFKYLAAMVQKDSSYRLLKSEGGQTRRAGGATRAPEIVETIPNIDHRYGDGRAEVMGIAVFDDQGSPLHLLEPSSRILVRISVRAKGDVAMPMVGFMLRNQLGIDFAGTNTAREAYELAPFAIRRHHHSGFLHRSSGVVRLGVFLFPAVADGTLAHVSNVRLDRQCRPALPMGRSEGEIYGYIHLPCRVWK